MTPTLKTIIAAVAAFISLSVPAFARPGVTHAVESCTWDNNARVVCITPVAPSGSVKIHRAAVTHPKIVKVRASAVSQLESTARVEDAGEPTDLIRAARQYLGSGPRFGRPNLWCARFMNYVLEREGYKTTGSDQASSFSKYGPHLSRPRVGAIAWTSGYGPTGHVGLVTGFDRDGDPIIISGNVRNRVVEQPFLRSQVHTYVMPVRLHAAAIDPKNLKITIEETGVAPTAPAPMSSDDGAFVLKVADARDYLVRTATPGGTMTRQGAAESIAKLHPVFALRLADAIREARAIPELKDVGMFSGYRPPAFGVGGFSDKFNSLHSYGIAADMKGIGSPGSAASQRWYKIAVAHGLFNPYGASARSEWNHYQASNVMMIARHNPLRSTITASGPKNLDRMWQVALSFMPKAVRECCSNQRLAALSPPPKTAPEEHKIAKDNPPGTGAFVIGFRGLGGAFDQRAFREYASARGLVPVILTAYEKTAALNLIKRTSEPYELYGFSLGAYTTMAVMRAKPARLPAHVITIGAYRTTSVDFRPYKVAFDNYFDASGHGQHSPGQYLNGVPHMQMQAAVNKILVSSTPPADYTAVVDPSRPRLAMQ